MGALTGPTPPGTRPRLWYGAQLAWWAPFERDAKREHSDRVTASYGPGRLTYRTRVEVPGRLAPVGVVAVFFATATYDTFGLSAQDYPQVWADPGAASRHRMPDGSLCLYNPFDPPQRRWRAEDGLLALLNLTRDHLFFEQHWRETDVWLGPEAPHGLPRHGAA